MIDHVRSALVNNLDDVIDTWADNWESDHDPEDHFSELKLALNEFKEEFDSHSDGEAISRIGIGLIRIDRIIQEKYGDMPAEPDYDNYRSSGPIDEQSDRSVFDDIGA